MNYLNAKGKEYIVKELDTLNDSWKDFDFSPYEIIFYVSGIAHQKENDENKDLYNKVNCELTFNIAEIAKRVGVKQFIFMSSMSVYGLNSYGTAINEKTRELPNTYYGVSKFNAEKKLASLASDDFVVSVLRPPMVYGEDSPGNLTKLFKIVDKIPIFPTQKNMRSAITIDRLCEFVFSIFDEQMSKIYFPQNNEFFCTSNVIKEYAEKKEKHIFFVSIFNPLIRIMVGRNKFFSKVFGNLYYDMDFNFIELKERYKNIDVN
ncbi:NAD-dependent epimerase/dehydratase family protein [Breznakia pachnodae]|uniref:UDP-glucose 4-epimerase n=1 Tax=Breznakia pachnodae TaxID=265178 RepID=A0ABU0DYU9_9FIRM|nr:NAD-dependent epimerase/dehydratase family protein [Breznakia pachnodae]MDQ0359818.1 UDP-glucose 4-epimerase [Breznakia pachnodae]